MLAPFAAEEQLEQGLQSRSTDRFPGGEKMLTL